MEKGKICQEQGLNLHTIVYIYAYLWDDTTPDLQVAGQEVAITSGLIKNRKNGCPLEGTASESLVI